MSTIGETDTKATTRRRTARKRNSGVRTVIAGTLLILFLVSVYPFETIVVPVWSLRVIDDQGKQVSGINVTQHWQHNLLESTGHEELQKTNDEGQVVFPQRTIRANLFSRVRSAAMKLLTEGSRARFNTYASVVVWGSKENETNVAVFEGVGVPPQQIVADRINTLP